ncbi:MAG: NUDIX hydrolase [Bdellovibrionaceae bacterium]|nr:NUDIX hydrolase [Pseudobdellovibrionaceae bacterium]
MTLKKWKVISTENLLHKGFFTLRVDKCELPDKRVMPHYYVFELSDWVNIVPITKEGFVILIKQYRHAGGEIFYEIPGGGIDSRNNEDPMTAAQRELLEETGYQAKTIEYKGFHYPNPALQNNKMHTFLAKDCVPIADQNLDEFEDIQVELVSKNEVRKKLKNGTLNHSLIVASLVRCLDELF